MTQPTTARPRIAAGTMVFNSWDIAPVVVAHLVTQGITDFYVVDHRSGGSPREEFLRRVPESAVIHWVHKETPYFTQAATLTALANLARQDGFDAFVPFDVDEFFTGTDRTLAVEIADWLENDTTRSLRCTMVNFYQSSNVETFSPSDLASVHYRAEFGEKPLENLVDRNPQFRRYPFSTIRYKAIMRLIPGPDGDLDWIIGGNHHIMNVSTGEMYPATQSTGIDVLHLPYRSRGGITARQGNALRKPRQGGTSLDTKSHEFSMTDDARDKEWRLASAPAGSTSDALLIGGVSAVRDDRLSRLEPAISATVRSSKSTPVSFIDETARMADIAQDLAMAAIDLAAVVKGTKAPGEKSVGTQDETHRNYRDLERKVVQLQAKIDHMRPNLLRLALNALRRR